MYVLIVTIQVKPEHRDAFIKEMIDDARGSRAHEPGNLRFDVIQDHEDPNKLYLYEVYRDEAAFQEHLKAPHFIKWRDAVKDCTPRRPSSRADAICIPPTTRGNRAEPARAVARVRRACR